MRSLVALLFLITAPVASAAELSFGLGAIGLDDNAEAAGIALEVRSAPFQVFGRTELRWGAAAELDTDADFWIGAGLVVTHPFAEVWRIDASVMPGLYAQGGGLDLGSVIEFRSLIGLSREVASETWLGLSISHKSNAGISDTNPGEEAVLLHLTRRF